MHCFGGGGGESEDPNHPMNPYFQFMPDRWVLIPTITVGHPKCECCDEGPVILSLDWLCFSTGLEINAPDHEA